MLENEAVISAIKETVKEVALILGGANLILIATISWLSKIWMNRILENERRKTQVIVEQLRGSLTQEREQSNNILKSQLDQSRYFFERTVSFFSETQKNIYDKRLDAFEEVWITVQQIRRLAPTEFDSIRENDYEKLGTSPNFRSRLEDYGETKLLEDCRNMDSAMESHRIYIPALIWQLYVSYRIIALRPILLLKLSLDSKNPNTSVIPWYRDPTIHTVIVGLLNAEELEEFNGLQLGHLIWILNRIEIKLLNVFQQYLSGDVLLTEMNEKAVALEQANRKVQDIYLNKTSD